MNRQEALEATAQCVLTDRNRDYGNPEDNFATTAAIWNACLYGSGHLKKPLEAHDVAALMVGLKLARLAASPRKLDTWVDMAGYAVCGVEVASGGEPVTAPVDRVDV